MKNFSITLSKNSGSFDAFQGRELKFHADSFSFETAKYFMIMKGVNLSFTSKDIETNAKYCWDLYIKEGDCFFNNFRGSFCGALFDKTKEKWIIFNNHIGDQKLFYFETPDTLFINNSIFELTKALKASNVNCSLNTNTAYCLLSYGYIPHNFTLINGINRLTAGQYMLLSDKEVEVKTYYEIDNTRTEELDEHEYIEQIDTLFSQAIRRQFEKDKLYGLTHIASMSGGLDCRMTNFAAKKNGYLDITNITFSQYGYLDMTLAGKISCELQNQWIFKSLDNGNFLKDIDNLVTINNLCTLYSGSAHSYDMLKNINFDNYGILHSGQLGDVTLGSYHTENAHKRAYFAKPTSKTLIHKTEVDFKRYQNQEEATYSIRGINGILSGNFAVQEFTETVSPFLDVDFLNFCMSIPIKKRGYHNIYKKWIISKYPEAAKYKWESINAKITDRAIRFRGKNIAAKQFPAFVKDSILYHLGKNTKHNTKNGMNPFDYWYSNNSSLSAYYQEYFHQYIDVIDDSELRKDATNLFNNGSTTEKSQVLTLLSGIKQLEL